MPIRIFTDGSSRGNPGPGGWAAIISSEERAVELGGREDHTTNNRMELSAALQALLWLRDHRAGGATIHSDSKYVIRGMTEWIAGWQRNGWKTAGKKNVENRDLWESLARAAEGLELVWRHVDGHAGVPANERCDEIATSFADRVPVALYDGPAKLYMIDLSVLVASSARKTVGKSSAVRAYSYLSLVDGALEIHKTWAECEKRVKGVRGAKFRKSFDKVDEERIIAEWTGK